MASVQSIGRLREPCDLVLDCDPTADTAVGSIEGSGTGIQSSDGGEGHAVSGADRMQGAIGIDLPAAAPDDNLSADNHRGQRARMRTSGAGECPCPVKVLVVLLRRGARRLLRRLPGFIPGLGQKC